MEGPVVVVPACIVVEVFVDVVVSANMAGVVVVAVAVA